MARIGLTAKDLRGELNDFHERFPRLGYDQLFVLWFLRVFVTENESDAAQALTGGAKDKGVDAVLIDDRTKSVFIAQGKYREKIAVKTEGRADVLGFAQLAVDLCGDNEGFNRLSKDLAPDVLGKLVGARRRIRDHNYRLQLYYVTTGKCSSPLIEEARRVVRTAESPATIEIVSGNRVLLLLSDYLDGVAPPVPSLDLEMESGGGVSLKGSCNVTTVERTLNPGYFQWLVLPWREFSKLRTFVFSPAMFVGFWVIRTSTREWKRLWNGGPNIFGITTTASPLYATMQKR